MNTCDGGHQTKHEVRVLPTSNDSNVIVCRECYKNELQYRLGKVFMDNVEQEFPVWKSLKLYQALMER